MKPPVFAFLAAGILLAGCNDDTLTQCPSAAVLSDTATVTGFRPGAPADPSGEAYTATITNVTTSCSAPKGSATADTQLGFTLRATRAPTPDGAEYTIPYYLAVSQGDRILSKKTMLLHLVFAPGSAYASQVIALDNTVITLEPAHPPTDYQMLVGFQLNDAQRAYNDKRTRYTP